jgi:hypothetical protein
MVTGSGSKPENLTAQINEKTIPLMKLIAMIFADQGRQAEGSFRKPPICLPQKLGLLRSHL